LIENESSVVARTASAQQARELALVLAAAGIRAVHSEIDGQHLFSVADADADRAREELGAYLTENPPPVPPAPPPRVIGRGLPGAVLYALLLLVAWRLQSSFAGGYDWTSAGRVDGQAMLDGQWWRAITALTLHGDFGHLTANLFFGTVFGGLAARYLGTGSAWLAIVAAGGLGNLTNAWLHGPDHRSIGASTAVFAALGLLGAFVAAHRRRGGARRWAERWGALVAAGAILAYTGTGGERTDVGAHLTGFAGGALFGWGLAWTSRARRPAAAFQVACGLAALGALLVAWTLALGAARP
jgi:membrane associated rhomboid family serine protease